MRSPAIALAWQVWGRHRRGLAVVTLGLAVFCVLFAAQPAGTPQLWQTAAACTMPFVMVLIYVAGIFAYGLESQLEARESGFPAWLFRLPVRTAVLVGWPMLQGMAALAILWATWAHFVLRPAGIDVPLGMTTLLAAAFVAVLQALAWLPFGLPWARVAAAVLVLQFLVLSPLFGPELGMSEADLVRLYALLIPLAYGVALLGVTRARRGQVPDWTALLWALQKPAGRTWRRLRSFSTPAQAQFWFERRRHLLSFPLLTACFATLHLAWVFWIEQQHDRKLAAGLNVVFFPPFLAPFLGCFMGRAGTSAGNPYSLSSFLATRPITSTALVVAKLKVAALATAAAWAVVLLAALVWLLHKDGFAMVPEWWNHLLQFYPAWKACMGLVLAVAGLVLITWKLLVDNLVFGLTGSRWLFGGSMVAYGVGLTLATMLFARATNKPGFADTLWRVLPLWASGALALKGAAAYWVLGALLRRKMVEKRTLAKLLGIWLGVAMVLFALAYAVVPPDEVSAPLLAFAVVLCLPLARVAAAPLAVTWNRHR